jgi:HSP20 family protein
MNMLLLRRPGRDLASWTPFNHLSELRSQINRLMENPLTEFAGNSEFFTGWVPPLDVYEDKDNILVKVEVPGLKKEQIDISLHDGVITISGERKLEEKNQDGTMHRSERYCGRFHRTVTLPKPVANDRVKATYKDGILTVTLPKTEEAKPRQIEVSVG